MAVVGVFIDEAMGLNGVPSYSDKRQSIPNAESSFK